MFAQALLGIAGRPAVRSLVTGAAVSRPVVRRFVAGDDVPAALQAVQDLAADGARVSLDRLGEDVTTPAEADATVAAYRDLVTRLSAEPTGDNPADVGLEVSVKLSALGQKLLPDGAARATARAHELVAHAAAHGVGVTVDMEDHTVVADTLAAVTSLREQHPGTGCVLQSMLRRTEDDARALAVPGSRVRIVKGAYAEPAEVAHPVKADVDLAYVRVLRTLLDGGAYPMVATHDTRLIAIAEELFAASGRERPGEFQMLYGIRVPEQLRLVRAGHLVRVYVPYGTDWYGYFSRRLAERPANLAFFARSLVRR